MRDRQLDHVEFRRRRKAAGLTQKQLATNAGVSESFVKLVDRGETNPSWPFALVLAEAMRCHAEDFMRPATSEAA